METDKDLTPLALDTVVINHLCTMDQYEDYVVDEDWDPELNAIYDWWQFLSVVVAKYEDFRPICGYDGRTKENNYVHVVAPPEHLIFLMTDREYIEQEPQHICQACKETKEFKETIALTVLSKI